MLAESATVGNEYMLSVMLRTGHARVKAKGTCIGWNHNHSKILFTLIHKGFRLAVALAPTEFIQPLE